MKHFGIVLLSLACSIAIVVGLSITAQDSEIDRQAIVRKQFLKLDAATVSRLAPGNNPNSRFGIVILANCSSCSLPSETENLLETTFDIGGPPLTVIDYDHVERVSEATSPIRIRSSAPIDIVPSALLLYAPFTLAIYKNRVLAVSTTQFKSLQEVQLWVRFAR